MISRDICREQREKDLSRKHERPLCLFSPCLIRHLFSGRHKAGGPAHIYSLRIDVSVEKKPQTILPPDNSETVSFFSISPDGNYTVASISESQSQESGAKEGISIWRDKTDLGGLCVANLQEAVS